MLSAALTGTGVSLHGPGLQLLAGAAIEAKTGALTLDAGAGDLAADAASSAHTAASPPCPPAAPPPSTAYSWSAIGCRAAAAAWRPSATAPTRSPAWAR